MQTAPSLRESVVELVDTVWFVAIYTILVVILAAIILRWLEL